MSQQVIVIGGGISFEKYADYLRYLKNKIINLDDFREGEDWKSNLRKDLGDNFDVLYISMPSRRNAKYNEWKIWFEKILKLSDTKLVLIGHSLGGMFLAKYLSENTVKKDLLLTILIAAPFKVRFNNVNLKGFSLPKSLSLLSKQSRYIYLVHSKDDPVVPYRQVYDYKRKLNKSKIKTFEKKGHFNQAHFKEIVNVVKNLK